MNISKEQIDDLNLTLSITIEEGDYKENIDKRITEIRKTAQLKGFRTGHVPKGMINKMYGSQVLVEEVNQLLSESLDKYLVDEKIEVLGRPMFKADDAQNAIDWVKDKEFTFAFDLGLKPELDVELTAKNKFTKYAIEVNEKDIDDTIKMLCDKAGNLEAVDVSDENSMIKGNFVEVDKKGEVIEEGISSTSTILPKVITKAKDKKQFVGIKKGDEVVFDAKKVFENETDLSMMLGIKKDQLDDLKNKIKFTVEQVEMIVPCEVNQDLFDKVFGKDAVKDEKEFREKVKAEKEKEYFSYADSKFKTETADKLIETVKIDLPDEFLKNFIKSEDDKITDEVLDKQYPDYAKNLKWELIKDSIAKSNDIKIENAEVESYAKESIKNQMVMQYGVPAETFPQDVLDNYYNEMKKNNPKEIEKMLSLVIENKVFDVISEKAKVTEKAIKWDAFMKLDSKK